MTNKQLNALKALFRDLNEKNKCHDRKYVCKVEKYDRNAYAMDVKFDIVFSTDHEIIMKFVFAEKLMCRISGSKYGAYLAFQ